MEHPRADRVWNRAALENGGGNPREGDRALAALLFAHGAIMNGGVHHGLEFLSAEELAAAKRGYSFFGLAAIGHLLEKARVRLQALGMMYSHTHGKSEDRNHP